MLTRLTTTVAWLGIALAASHAIAQPAVDLEGVQAASKAFYAALAVLDNGEAMEKVWAHTPYVTLVGPRSKSILVGWDAQKQVGKSSTAHPGCAEQSAGADALQLTLCFSFRARLTASVRLHSSRS
jgi:hypothetical protein